MPGMRPLATTFAALALFVPASGCCSLARLFCGPDTSPWISVDYTTPTNAVRTLLEAFRRDDAQVVSTSLSSGFLQRMDGDSLAVQVLYDRLKQELTGLHLAGYAEVPAPTMLDDGRARFLLDVEGTEVQVDLVRETLWNVRYRRPNGTPGETGGRVDGLTGLADVELLGGDDERSRLTLRPLTFWHIGLDEVPLEQVEFAGVERRWKVDALKVRQ